MLIKIEYLTDVLQIRRVKTFIRPSVEEVLKFFKWRYGHTIISINGEPYSDYVKKRGEGQDATTLHRPS